MFRQVVRYNGFFYIIRYNIWGREWYDQDYKRGHWWTNAFKGYATLYSSKADAIEAYHAIDEKRKQRRQTRKIEKVYP